MAPQITCSADRARKVNIRQCRRVGSQPKEAVLLEHESIEIPQTPYISRCDVMPVVVGTIPGSDTVLLLVREPMPGAEFREQLQQVRR